MNNKALVLKNISLSVKNRVIFSDLNMELGEGERALLLGPSGSGKSTLLKLVMGLLEPSDGWTVKGERLKLPPSFGWVSQNPSRDIFNNWVKEEASIEYLRLFGADGLEGRKCFELSEGEKVLVSLAKAFSRRFILLDEAGVSLAANNRALLKKNIRSSSATVIMAEHSAEYIDIADRIFLMNNGRAEEISPARAKEYLTHMPEGLRRVHGGETFGEGDILEIISDKLSLKLRHGEAVGISGDNGCGKSSLLNSVAGLEGVSAARVLWKGKALSGLKQRRGLMGFVPQEPGRYLFETSAEKQCETFGIGDAAKTAFDLNFPRGVETSQLSGGEKQRLAIAGAADKDILILDEPTFGLDRASIGDLFRAVNSKCLAGGLALIASHDTMLLNTLCDRRIEIET